MKKNPFVLLLIIPCLILSNQSFSREPVMSRIPALPSLWWQTSVTFYEHSDFQGASKVVYNNMAWVGDDWNDKISSIRVPAGYILVAYQDGNYQGPSVEITGNWTVTPSNLVWNDRISSFIIKKAAPSVNYTPPSGYTRIAAENETKLFNQKVDVAYGANGVFRYKNGVTGNVAFNNSTFGDPVPGIPKAGYYKISGPNFSPPAGYTLVAYENETKNFNQVVDVAYGVNGVFRYKNGMSGNIAFNNASFGDPVPGIQKAGYYKLAAVNGLNAIRASYSALNGTTRLGDFVKTGDKAWQEKSFQNANRSFFTETGRDDWSVYLYDKSRDVYIQLDFWTKKIFYHTGSNANVELYKIVD